MGHMLDFKITVNEAVCHTLHYASARLSDRTSAIWFCYCCHWQVLPRNGTTVTRHTFLIIGRIIEKLIDSKGGPKKLHKTIQKADNN